MKECIAPVNGDAEPMTTGGRCGISSIDELRAVALTPHLAEEGLVLLDRWIGHLLPEADPTSDPRARARYNRDE